LRDNTINILFKLQDIKVEDVFSFMEFFEKNKNDIDMILEIIITVYRDLLAFNETGNRNLLINKDKMDVIVKNARNFTSRKLLNNLGLLAETRLNLKYNSNFQLTLEVMLMKLQGEAV
jgi:DNA polymerase-3 subunit delta'